jgi:hypothetical protein
MSGLWDGLVNMWGLGDYGGTGTVLKDSGPGGNDGVWKSPPLDVIPDTGVLSLKTGVECVRCCTVECQKCPCPDTSKGYLSLGWTRTNDWGGGFVPYPGGSAWYDAQYFTFSFWTANLLIPPPTYSGPCKITVWTDFPVTPWGVGAYFGAVLVPNPDDPTGPLSRIRGDYVSWAGKVYRCKVDYISDGSVPPDVDTAHWYAWDDDVITKNWTDCYDANVPLYRGGIVGDHSGFPYNVGWWFTTDIFHQTRNDDPRKQDNPVAPSWDIRFNAESNGAFAPLSARLQGEFHRGCQMITLRCDGTHVDIFKNGAQVLRLPAAGMMSSNTGLGFGWADENKALSGSFINGQSMIDDALLWNRPLSNPEILELWGQEWCDRQFSLATHHRAEPSENAAASPLDTTVRHLSGTRFRAEPAPGALEDSASAVDLTQPAHLSNTRFRAE